MARKNRVSLPDSTYHLTARVVNKAYLFADSAIKDWIVDRIYGVADFCGVDVLAWCVMDNHLHLLVHVPEVPTRYRTSAESPATYAFGMRPPACNVPLWSPTGIQPSAAADGDSPRVAPSRPPLDFMLDDDEMQNRLLSLYGNAKKVASIRRRWDKLRESGRDREIELEKEGYCRRMYNVSHFMKTLKESVAAGYNFRRRREGQLWDGRFYSGVVERVTNVLGIVASYIDLNPVRAGIVKIPDGYRWNSFTQALGKGKYARRCREGYEAIFGLAWTEAEKMMRRILDDKVRKMDGVGGIVRPRASLAIRTRIRVLSHGAFIGIDESFGRTVVAFLPQRYPAAQPDRDIADCRRLDWSLPSAAAA